MKPGQFHHYQCARNYQRIPISGECSCDELYANMDNEEKPRQNVSKVVSAIQECAKAYPYQRIGQIIVNACEGDPFYTENKDMAKRLRSFARKANKK